MNNEFFTVREHHEYMKEVLMKTPSWQDFIDQIDFSFLNKLLLKGNPDFGIVIENSDTIRHVRNLEHRIIKNNPNHRLTHTQCYLSLSSKSTTFGKHNDTTDVWFWQCIGQTKWTVWDPDPITYILSPGDIIYVPVGMYHDPRPVTPRAGMSIGIKK
jgi:hypothetical protein